MNTLKEGSCPKPKKPFTKEAQLENIAAFLEGAKKYGVPEDKLFQPADLHEGSNIPAVIGCLLAVGRKVHSTCTASHPAHHSFT